VLIVDNAPTHVVQGVTPAEKHGLKVFNLSNIKVVFLPPNVTAKSQPCDQGIIASYKAHYRRYLVQWLLEVANKPGNEGKQLKDLAPTIYQAMQWSLRAWKENVTAQTIKNCWRKSGLLPDSVLNPPAAADAAGMQLQNDDEAVDAEAQLAADPALQELTAAIQHLQALAVQRGLLPEGQELASAEDFVELEGESEVFEELADDEIVALVQSRDVDKPDSDEDELDEPLVSSVSMMQAVSYAEQLESFAFANPDMFNVEQMLLLGNIRRDLQQKRQAKMR
jgi:hypothetical protein